jgi:hypothetical protein
MDSLSIVLTAGKVMGLLMVGTEEDWRQAADTPVLHATYKLQIELLIEARRKLLDTFKDEPRDGD